MVLAVAPDKVEATLGAVSEIDLRCLPIDLIGVVVLKLDLSLTIFLEYDLSELFSKWGKRK